MGAFSISRTISLIIAILAGVILGFTTRVPHWIIAFAASNTAASWIQAAGSLIGLGIAIWVPHRLARKAEHAHAVEAGHRAMGIGLAIRLELKRIKWPLTRIINQWPEGKDAPLLIDLGEGGQREIFEYFEFPKMITNYYGRLHELAGAAKEVLLAVNKAEEVRMLLDSLETDLAHTGGDDQVSLEARLRPAIVSCLGHTNRSLELIDEMFK